MDALSAVAEILSYLYRLNGKVMDGELWKTEAGRTRNGRPDPMTASHALYGRLDRPARGG